MNVRRIRVVSLSIALQLIVLLTGVTASEKTAPRPNVLFIAADDLRNDLGCYGHSQVISPNLDRLAKRGLIFDRAYCQQAVCNPSRASLLTGKRLDTLQIWDLPTHFRNRMPNVVTLPEHFKQNGYFTQNIGKIFHNWIHKVKGDPKSWSVPAAMHFATHSSDVAELTGQLPKNYAFDIKCERRDVPDEAYFDGRIANMAVKTLQNLANDNKEQQPFFLAVGFWKPHSPFNAPVKYWDLYRRKQIRLAKNFEWPEDAPRIAWHNSREILGRKRRRFNRDNAREIRHGYLAAISYLDAQVGKVLDELEATGLADNTIVVFWSDHGYHLGEQTLWAKTSNFELDARVPMIISYPEMKHAGERTDSLVELLDLYPTLVELAGLDSPGGLEGKSLVPILENPKQKVRRVALSQHPRPAYFKGAPDAMGYSIRSATHRYTEWRNWQTGETIATELYDHENDPDETKNLAAKKDAKPLLKKHAKLLKELNPVVRPGWTPVLPVSNTKPVSRSK